MTSYSILIFVVTTVALLLSAYTLYVEAKAENDKNYRAVCDINEKISCSKVFTSEYGTGFGLKFLPEALKLPNGIYGIAFYGILLILNFSRSRRVVKAQLFLSVSSIALSVYLGYILIFVLNDVCVVCVSTYVLNIINTILVLKKLNEIQRDRHAKQL